MMRPMAMDFPDDPRLREPTDEYMFGPSFLVSPIVHYKQRSRNVILPQGLWYDFWSGQAVAGGSTYADAPYDRIPIHVRAGSIVPIGPDIKYTGERPADPITLVVYTGADGKFSLYEDDGVTNGYERGEFARIPMSWSERSHTVTIGKREGSFKGMLESRTFRVVYVTPDRPIPFSFDLPADQSLVYTGAAVTIKLSDRVFSTR